MPGLFFGWLLLGTLVAGAAEPAKPTAIPNNPAYAKSFAISESQARASVQWLADLAIKNMPSSYEGDKDWGDTKKIWSGVKIRRDGFQLKTHRRWKEVRHGRWIKYELILPPATGDKSRDVTATVHRVMRDGDLQTGTDTPSDTHWRIESSIEAPMAFSARMERWNFGVQLYSLSIKGKLRVRLDSTATLTSFADYGEVPPALVIDPRIQNAELFLEEFEVDRISKIGGDVAEEWGELMEKVVRDVFLKKQNEKLVGKLNKSIDKQRDDLRLSLSDWFDKL